MIRAGVQALLGDALRRRFDVVLTESLDRLSRDQEDIAGFYKRTLFAGIKIVTLAEGEISELHVGLKGTMGALYLKDLALKTRRGLEGRVRAGRSGGGLCYGYKIARETDAAGNPIRGGRVIDEAEAEVIRRIFRDYAAGRSSRAIAWALNKDGIPGPFGHAWGPSTIHRQPEARQRHPQQRALRRPAGLEPAAVRQGPGHRQACFAPEPARRVGDPGRARAAHR